MASSQLITIVVLDVDIVSLPAHTEHVLMTLEKLMKMKCLVLMMLQVLNMELNAGNVVHEKHQLEQLENVTSACIECNVVKNQHVLKLVLETQDFFVT